MCGRFHYTSTSGTLNVSIDDAIPEVEAVALLEMAISDALGVHISDVVVSINEDGEITYSISEDTYDNAYSLFNDTSADRFISLVNEKLESTDSTIVLESVTTDNKIEVS